MKLKRVFLLKKHKYTSSKTHQINSFILILLLFFESVYSQNWVRIDSVFTPTEIPTISFSSPFFCDIDGDGDQDLFLASSSLSSLLFFRNVGTPEQPRFSRDDYFLKEVNEKEYHNSIAYVSLADLDGDGDFDLILGTFRGLQYYKNVGDKNYPIFFKIDNFFFEVNKYIGNDGKPCLIDIDSDGDLDLFIGIGESLFGGPRAGTILGFRNTGKRYFPRFVKDNALTRGISDLGLNAFPAFADLNQNGKPELLVGRDQSTFAFFVNTGTTKNPYWQRQSITFGNFETKTLWKNPVFVDIDNDGDYDLVYGTADGELYFYRNIGILKKPKFQRESQLFEPIRITGGAGSVAFGDFDKDGDLDFISGDYLGNFQFFRNVGNKFHPAFKKDDRIFANIKVPSFSTPIFIDLNLDGNLDIISGALDGKIYSFINTRNGFVENPNTFRKFKVRERSSPAVVDINNDGFSEILICSNSPNDYLFLINDGKNNFYVDNSILDKVTFPYDARPAFEDVDCDGDFDLIIGGRDGRLIYYENTGTNVKPIFELNRDLFKDTKVKQNSSPGLADLDGDDRVELILADYGGNFFYFKANFPRNLVNFYARAKEDPVIYVWRNNPFERIYKLNFKISKARDILNPFKPEFVLINVYNLRGEFIKSVFSDFLRPGEHEISIDLKDILKHSGAYLYTVQISNGEFHSGRIFYVSD